MPPSEATNLLQLAMGLVTQLGLDRRPSILHSSSAPAPKDHGAKPQHTLEEMRAVLGTFYVSSL